MLVLSHGQLLVIPWLQPTRLPCPSLSPTIWSNSCPLSCWYYLTVSSFAVPFSFYLQPFSVSGSFLMSRFFASGDQSIGASASASALPVNIQGWFPLGHPKGNDWFDLLEVQLKSLLQNHNLKASVLLYGLASISIHDNWKKSKLWQDRSWVAKWCPCFWICYLSLS